jgi:UDP-N-acetyl-D-glucosamine dehydrogenase
MKSINLTPEAIKGYDCVLVATHHQAYDWQMVADNASLVVDTRNALKGVRGKRDHVVMA